jgi:hypothetical protein
MTSTSSAPAEANLAPERGLRPTLLAALRYAADLAFVLLVVEAMLGRRPAARLLLAVALTAGVLGVALRRGRALFARGRQAADAHRP